MVRSDQQDRFNHGQSYSGSLSGGNMRYIPVTFLGSLCAALLMTTSAHACTITAAGDYICDGSPASNPDSAGGSGSDSDDKFVIGGTDRESSSSGGGNPPPPNSAGSGDFVIGGSGGGGGGGGSPPVYLPPGTGSSGGSGSAPSSNLSDADTMKYYIDNGIRDFLDHIYVFPDGTVSNTYFLRDENGDVKRNADGSILEGTYAGKTDVDGSFIEYSTLNDFTKNLSPAEKAALIEQIEKLGIDRYKEVMLGEGKEGEEEESTDITVYDPTKPFHDQLHDLLMEIDRLINAEMKGLEKGLEAVRVKHAQDTQDYEAALAAYKKARDEAEEAGLEPPNITLPEKPRPLDELLAKFEQDYFDKVDAGMVTSAEKQVDQLLEFAKAGSMPDSYDPLGLLTTGLPKDQVVGGDITIGPDGIPRGPDGGVVYVFKYADGTTSTSMFKQDDSGNYIKDANGRLEKGEAVGTDYGNGEVGPLPWNV